MKWELTDWIILSLVTGILVASTVYLFQHAGDTSFITWSGLCGTVISAYHWLNVKDSKEKDAPC